MLILIHVDAAIMCFLEKRMSFGSFRSVLLELALVFTTLARDGGLLWNLRNDHFCLLLLYHWYPDCCYYWLLGGIFKMSQDGLHNFQSLPGLLACYYCLLFEVAIVLWDKMIDWPYLGVRKKQTIVMGTASSESVIVLRKTEQKIHGGNALFKTEIALWRKEHLVLLISCCHCAGTLLIDFYHWARLQCSCFPVCSCVSSYAETWLSDLDGLIFRRFCAAGRTYQVFKRFLWTLLGPDMVVFNATMYSVMEQMEQLGTPVLWDLDLEKIHVLFGIVWSAYLEFEREIMLLLDVLPTGCSLLVLLFDAIFLAELKPFLFWSCKSLQEACCCNVAQTWSVSEDICSSWAKTAAKSGLLEKDYGQYGCCSSEEKVYIMQIQIAVQVDLIIWSCCDRARMNDIAVCWSVLLGITRNPAILDRQRKWEAFLTVLHLVVPG